MWCTCAEVVLLGEEEVRQFETEENGKTKNEEVATRVHVNKLQVRQTNCEARSCKSRKT